MEKHKILFVLALLVATASAASLGQVQTEGGLVQGQNIPVGVFRSIDVFKGIPFAAKPGIFEKPKPHPGWDGILQATKFAEPCLQVNMEQTSSVGSNDCLHLNIWVPQGTQLSSNLPVMVWIYGGGFMVGSTTWPDLLGDYIFNGQEIANKGDVIVVTLGYRVGVLGFLSTGDSRLPGNYGLWDQHAAIAWVHRNIRSFGGDPDNITIFGESAGGASVSFQTLSPHNKGLVRRAIAQSGDALCPWAVNENPRNITEQVALNAGCPVDERMVACLRSLDARTLAVAAPKTPQPNPDNPGIKDVLLTPVVDGDFLPDKPLHLFHNAAEIDYLAGVNDMDGFSFTATDIPSLRNRTEETPAEDVTRLLTAYAKDMGPEAVRIAFAEYFSRWGPSPSQETIQRTAVDIGTDYIFLVSTQAALNLRAANAVPARTFSYLLSEPNLLAGPGTSYPDWMGADHTDDLLYVFGKPFTYPHIFGDRQKNLSGYMIAYWANFARTGNPNNGILKVPVTWPEYTSATQKFLDIHAEMNESSVREKMRYNFVKLWTKTLPNLKSHAATDIQ